MSRTETSGVPCGGNDGILGAAGNYPAQSRENQGGGSEQRPFPRARGREVRQCSQRQEHDENPRPDVCNTAGDPADAEPRTPQGDPGSPGVHKDRDGAPDTKTRRELSFGATPPSGCTQWGACCQQELVDGEAGEPSGGAKRAPLDHDAVSHGIPQ